jgi:SAM-dependent methyltransferase
MNESQATGGTRADDPRLTKVRDYWNLHIHDLKIVTQPIGTVEFFQELADYRFEKLSYLPHVVDFTAYRSQRLLEVGCGVGIDLIRFARAGAIVTGVDLADTSIELAKKNFAASSLTAELHVMNGEDLAFDDESFDVVYAHGVLQYTVDAQRMVNELHRVLRAGGETILMVYNRISWLNLLSKVMSTELEHADAPVLDLYSIKEFRSMLRAFAEVRIVPERFPVKTRLHHGIKATLYNDLFVSAFGLLPKAVVRPFGWHLMAFARK